VAAASDKMSLSHAPPLQPQFEENDLSRNSRAQAYRNAAPPRPPQRRQQNWAESSTCWHEGHRSRATHVAHHQAGGRRGDPWPLRPTWFHPQGAACRGEAALRQAQGGERSRTAPRPYLLVTCPRVIEGLGRYPLGCFCHCSRICYAKARRQARNCVGSLSQEPPEEL